MGIISVHEMAHVLSARLQNIEVLQSHLSLSIILSLYFMSK